MKSEIAIYQSVLTSKAATTVAGYELIRKDVSNDCFGWWTVKDGRSGFISLPNLIAEVRRKEGY